MLHKVKTYLQNVCIFKVSIFKLNDWLELKKFI